MRTWFRCDTYAEARREKYEMPVDIKWLDSAWAVPNCPTFDRYRSKDVMAIISVVWVRPSVFVASSQIMSRTYGSKSCSSPTESNRPQHCALHLSVRCGGLAKEATLSHLLPDHDSSRFFPPNNRDYWQETCSIRAYARPTTT